ncbi:acetate--CoA ligase family protein [Candidatus Pacearchaeota archaeon]|nr:acetate--CoA ligase family protein [Candidatus Pacearchaeota archaeon]
MKEVYNEYKAEQFLRRYLPVARSQLVHDSTQVTLPLPLVLKIISDDALHKSEVHGVRVVKTQDDLEREFSDLIENAKKRKLKIDGILVQEYCWGTELIMGIKNDEVFGHVIVFGVGGIFTEILKDTSTRKCPITAHDADEMMEELKAKDILHGARGVKVNREFLKHALVAISKIPGHHPHIEELDINPFMADEEGGKVVDARIVFNTK